MQICWALAARHELDRLSLIRSCLVVTDFPRGTSSVTNQIPHTACVPLDAPASRCIARNPKCGDFVIH